MNNDKQHDLTFDTIEKLDHSLIQHGPVNDRIYLMKLSNQDLPELLDKIDALAEENDYSKIFTKVPLQVKPMLESRGYVEEAMIPGFFHGDTEAVFLSRFPDPQRENSRKQEEITEILDVANQKSIHPESKSLPDGFEIRQVGPDETTDMAEIFKTVFESYPFPVYDADYLRETMESHIEYFAVYENGSMAAVSSAEMDTEASNAEMTDFATLEDYRGQGLASCLLSSMEEEMADQGIQTAYTIARSLSAGMNITFARAGYTYTGTLTNNTHICGRLESMNVWYKSLET